MQGLPPVAPNDKGERPTYVLSPGDLVYLPTVEERACGAVRQPLDRTRIYKVVSSDSVKCYFVPYSVAKVIVDGKEYESHNKIAKTDEKEMIKESCIPLKVDRLGNILGFKEACLPEKQPADEQNHD